jgi:hypothetical protein
MSRDTSLDDHDCGDCDGPCVCCPGTTDGNHVAGENDDCDYCGARVSDE